MDAKAVSSSIARFAAKFCNELNKDTSVVSSPLSAEFVLGLVALGAEGAAHTELLTALGIPDDDAIRSSFSSVSSNLRSLKGVTLNVANRVYLKEGPWELQPRLKEDAVKVFDAGFEKVNFGNAAAAAQLINQWVESKTNNKIKDLLSADAFGEDTRLVLVNALYFKGSWKTQFNPAHTQDQLFNVNANNTIQIPMMFKKAEYKIGFSEQLGAQFLEMPYEGDEATIQIPMYKIADNKIGFSEQLGAQFLEMPYAGNETSMVIVLPNEIEGLNDVMKKLADGHDLMKDLNQMHSTKVEVTIPKFKIETEIELIGVLKKLGIKSIFDSSSSGLDKMLNPREPLFVSKAVQKAFIEVNEEGAEAAAATAFGSDGSCAMVNFIPPPRRFVADRPFLAAVMVKGVPYFMATFRR